MKNVGLEDFVILQLTIGCVFQNFHDVLKNGVLISCIGLKNRHWPSIDCPISNVINTFKEMVRRHLVDWPFDKFGPHPMFLYSRLKWKPSDDI